MQAAGVPTLRTSRSVEQPRVEVVQRWASQPLAAKSTGSPRFTHERVNECNRDFATARSLKAWAGQIVGQGAYRSNHCPDFVT